ncbi:MAG: hypothetical protein KAT68_18155 [Bacteroidales bacterium]|nr:hypothetical protein [Bacteroidales bacterium]
MKSEKKCLILTAILFCFINLHTNENMNQEDSLYALKSNTIEETDSIAKNISFSNEILNKINSNLIKTIPKSILGLPVNLIITFLLSLIVSLISVYWAYYNTTIRKRNNLIILYKYMINFLIKATKEQSNNFIKLTELLKAKKSFVVYPLEMKCDFNLNALKKLPLDIIIEKIMKRKTQSRILSTFLTKLNILDSISNRYQVDFEKMVDKFNQYLKVWNYNIDKIREGFDSYVTFFKTSGGYRRGVDVFFDKFDIIYFTFQKQEDYLDYYVTIEYLLNPLHKLCKDNMENITALTLLNHILACKASFDDYVRTKEIYYDIFTNYSKLIQDSSDFIENNIDNVFNKQEVN